MGGGHLFRPGRDPGEALRRDRAAGHHLPPGPPQGRGPDPVPPVLHPGRGGSPLLRCGQRLRAAHRRHGGAHRRGPGRRPAGDRAPDRGPALRAERPGRAHLRGQELLHRARAGRGPGLCAVPRRPGELGQGRGGQGRAAPARGAGRAAGPGGGHHAGDPAVAGRGTPARLRLPGRGHRGPVAGAEDGRLAHRHHDRGLRPRPVPRRLPRGARGGRPGQGRGQRRRPSGRPGRARSPEPARRPDRDPAGQRGRREERPRNGRRPAQAAEPAPEADEEPKPAKPRTRRKASL